jgi:hypothetical protein
MLLSSADTGFGSGIELNAIPNPEMQNVLLMPFVV